MVSKNSKWRLNLLHGLTPTAFNDDVHALRCLAQLRSKDKSIEKYIYLSMLKEQDPSMFYKLCLQYMSEFTPVIYTPTVGDACLQFSHIYRRPEGLFISIKDKGKIREGNLLPPPRSPWLMHFVSHQQLAQDRRG
ncbi:hypothetical protein H0H93_012181 [Arthromyces matolae]|nr:hypothetical protein H0H93_012181 [Arthromyces matolae]